MRLSDGTVAFADHSPKGLKFSVLGDANKEVMFSWAQVASRLRTVAFDDRYLSEDEKSRLEEVRESLNARMPAETKDMPGETGTTLFSDLGEADSIEFKRNDVPPYADKEPATDATYSEEPIDDVSAQGATSPENFRITDDELGYGGPKAKFRMNAEAIRTLKRIESEGRAATKHEMEVLSRYVGWGGIPDAFDATVASWKEEYDELRGLLSDDEYASARASTLHAHYTSPAIIKAIYKSVGEMGFEGGNVLEPACGIGNFFGLLPEAMEGSRLFGVELDSISARIAGALYPKAQITHGGFEKTDVEDFYDLAIGNVPFGNYRVRDEKFDRLGFPIHDYFFAKTLSQVRPGGIIAYVTSRFTLDKEQEEARRYIASRAELLGAVRLPENAFLKNAGTEVVSDILFLKRREVPTTEVDDWVHVGRTADGLAINSYFIDHPEMVLGHLARESTQYGHDALTVKPYEDADLAALLDKALENVHGSYVPARVYDIDEDDLEVDAKTSVPADPNVKNYSYVVANGALYFREGSVMVRPEMNARAQERVRGLIEIRDCVRKLIDLQLEGAADEPVKAQQKTLDGLYEDFVSKYGLINSRANSLAFSDDSSYYLLCSLEVLDEEGNLARKADMFTERTIKAHTATEHTDTSAEALAVSISERARVDMKLMERLTGKDEEAIVEELKGVIFRDFSTGGGNYVTADEFLSGDIRKKIKDHKTFLSALDEDDERYSAAMANLEALSAAKPKDLEATEIDVRLGATWVDARFIEQFMYEVFKTPTYERRRINVAYAQVTGEWRITGKNSISYGDVTARTTFGTARANAYRILEDTLNLRDVRIYDTVEDQEGKKHRILNKAETTKAQQKQQMIKDAWASWVWQDAERRHELVKTYNELFNAVRLREYDGSHIAFSGMNPEIRLRTHQTNAVARILYGGNTLLAHEVGAGKTFSMAAAAMESKRLGLCTKSLFAVPNHLTEQWASEFLRLYPSANILVATKRDFERANRKKFCSRIATGNWDAVILGHSQFERIPLSRERQVRFLEEQIEEIEIGIAEVKAADGERYTIKQMEKSRKSLKARLEKLNAENRKDDVVTFEELGCDRLFVDEAHSYKNLFLYTKMRNVAGLSTSEAQKSSDMLLKCRYMDEITAGRGVVFATGTPVSNSMTELYTMMRYLQHDMLEERRLAHFDSWASVFGETTTAIELAPEGTGYRARTRFAKFHNVPELMTLWKEAADIKTSDELGLPVPEVEFHNIAATPSTHQREMVEELSERAAKVHNRMVDPSVDNMLKITTDGRKLGLDQRIINPLLPDEPKSKVNLCAENILRIYREGEQGKLTQLVFCDLSTPKGAKGKTDAEFCVYDDMRQKLIEGGVREDEIAFIHDANTEVRKRELFVRVRSGDVRVLFGSTSKMGAGTNVQDRLIALHDLDCPWRPGDLEQRKGRIVRQGNTNPCVHIYRYVTENTFDAYLWQTVENKQRFISQVMTSKSPVRSCDDIDETALTYAEIKALCAGDPHIKEKMDLDVEVARLKVLKADYESQRFRLQDDILIRLPKRIAKTEENIAAIESDMKTLKAHPVAAGEFAGMSVNGRLYSEKSDAGEAIITACGQSKTSRPVEIGTYRGFSMEVSFSGFDYRLTLKGAATHTVELGTSSQGNLIRIDNALAHLPERAEEAKERLEDLHHQMAASKTELEKPFLQEAELIEKSARLAELDSMLDMDERDAASPIDEGKDEQASENLESSHEAGYELQGDGPMHENADIPQTFRPAAFEGLGHARDRITTILQSRSGVDERPVVGLSDR